MQNQDQPLLSICIPTYNRAEILRETLAHLVEISDPSFEIVVSDNCSSDNTIKVLEDFRNKWQRFRYITQAKGIDVMENCVAAALMAQGKYLYSFCDDDRIIIEGINDAVRMLEDAEDLVGVFGGCQEVDPKKGIVGTNRHTDKTLVFPKGSKSKMDVFKLGRLWFPVIRTEICQRFCVTVYNKFSWGHWPFVGRMLDQGAIAVIPAIFYKHIHTEPRGEYNLTEGWCHDKYRADFELYMGESGQGKPENAMAVSLFAGNAYLQAVKFAKIKGEWLTGRNFLLRARAYGLVKDEELLSFEKLHLVQMVAEHLKTLVSLAPDIRKIVMEHHQISTAILPDLAKLLPKVEICQIDREGLLECPTKPDEFVIALDYKAIQDRGIKQQMDPLRQYSLMDAFENCRLIKA